MYHIYVYEYNQFFKILNFDNLIIQKKINVNIILLKIFFCLMSFNLTTLNLLEIYSYVRFLMHFIKAFVIFLLFISILINNSAQMIFYILKYMIK